MAQAKDGAVSNSGAQYGLPFPFLPLLGVSQSLAAESMRYWARRAHACGDYLQAMSTASDPTQVLSAQSTYVRRLFDDVRSEADAAANVVRDAAGVQAQKN